ncbi:uncharacterized protein LOC119657837 isoform X1 [Hermetia illucens]|uniref:uncharacterized protein LOC119657837 isoform X1 n=1 Tax=Hermetia illucens TaxID=343691 RepID=UPI0018CC611A|nr:uncharacterized protein LOC119657837 isoform X1 [Hermetia illucens]XP_037920887.1 uncharacterized protein LOC119657837 isoform X1 [Hermetia illucens]
MTSADKSKNINSNNNNMCNKHGRTNWNTKVSCSKDINTKCSRHHKNTHGRKTESVLSTDSDIRFTRRKLGDSQKCGCAVVATFLVALLVAGIFVYIGYTYFRPDPLPERVFRGEFRVVSGDEWSMELADQNSLRFQHKARDYRERINLIIRRSDLREAYDGSEILGLDGTVGSNELVVIFNLLFDPYRGLVSTADLLAIFSEEFNSQKPKYFTNVTVEPMSLFVKEVSGLVEEPPTTASSPLEILNETSTTSTTPKPQRQCSALQLTYCRSIGYNVTTYPNLLGHESLKEVQEDVISFRELVDAECFREAFDIVCRLLQPPCEVHEPFEPTVGKVCREYCQAFLKGCENRLPERFRKYFDCERFPESTGPQSCYAKPNCVHYLQSNAQSPRLCDGIPDCPDLSDERSCTFCNSHSLYCGRGRACVPKIARCDGKIDCPDGADEKDCLAIAPSVSFLVNPPPLTPYLPRFYSEGFAVFSEKGTTGKLCAEGLEGHSKASVRQAVATSLCKSLGYDSVKKVEIRNDTEPIKDYVRVLDPYAPEISFVRTACRLKQALFVECGHLECGIQSALSTKYGVSLPKTASPGDWPWIVALYREDTHVCDGTLISSEWVLTTESCFQGQPKATWLAIFGAVRLSSQAPWTQRRRIIGLVKSPVEGSTAALIRLETPVEFSDFIRPVCLPDEATRRIQSQSDNNIRSSPNKVPMPQRLESETNLTEFSTSTIKKIKPKETDEFFTLPILNGKSEFIQHSRTGRLVNPKNTGDIRMMPKPEAVNQFISYPLPNNTPQTEYFAKQSANMNSQSLPMSYITPRPREQVWTNCNTLGWSRQRDHLQRVQLKIGDMAHCENISIATVNSICTESTFQQNDCTGEEYAGTPVQCLLPNTNQWALVGVASWRIACAPTGLERPRMVYRRESDRRVCEVIVIILNVVPVIVHFY